MGKRCGEARYRVERAAVVRDGNFSGAACGEPLELWRWLPCSAGARARPAAALPDEIVPTGFGRLDALLGTGGLPRGVSASFRGARSSGKTALALHCLAQAQARGGIVAFLDLCRIFDPLEAVARGVDLRWLLVVRPADIDEGWSLAAALVSGRQVDLLVVDLPATLTRQPREPRCAGWRHTLGVPRSG